MTFKSNRCVYLYLKCNRSTYFKLMFKISQLRAIRHNKGATQYASGDHPIFDPIWGRRHGVQIQARLVFTSKGWQMADIPSKTAVTRPFHYPSNAVVAVDYGLFLCEIQNRAQADEEQRAWNHTINCKFHCEGWAALALFGAHFWNMDIPRLLCVSCFVCMYYLCCCDVAVNR